MLAAQHFCRSGQTTLAFGTVAPQRLIVFIMARATITASRRQLHFSRNDDRVEHCFREAGAGGSNPLAPTSIFAIFRADLGAGQVPEKTERDANIRHRL